MDRCGNHSVGVWCAGDCLYDDCDPAVAPDNALQASPGRLDLAHRAAAHCVHPDGCLRGLSGFLNDPRPFWNRVFHAAALVYRDPQRVGQRYLHSDQRQTGATGCGEYAAPDRETAVTTTQPRYIAPTQQMTD